MGILSYCVLFHPEQSGGYSTTVPDFPGCFSQGDTLAEACAMTTDAIGLCIEDLRANAQPLPSPSTPTQVNAQAPDFVEVLPYDPVSYAKRQSTV